MDLDKKRWIVLGLGCLINLCAGSLYGWSVLSVPMESYLNEICGAGIAAGGLAAVFTVANMVGPITMIPGGRMNDMLGPRWVIFIGGLLFGGGMLMSGFATSKLWLIITYGLGCGLGMGMVYGCNIGNSVKFFPDKKGLAGGLATASYGISSVIMPPVANALNSSIGVTGTFKVLGIVFLIVICAGGLLTPKCPEDYRPKGYVQEQAQNGSTLEFNWKQMLASADFYLMLFMMTCGAISGLMCISQASGIAQHMISMTVSEAAVAVSVLALFNTAGRIAAGYASDKIGRTNTMAAAFVMSAAGVVTLWFTKTGAVQFYIAICLIGLSFGAIMGIYPAFTAERFGSRNNTVNYGIMFIGFAIAGYLGPTIMKTIFNSAGQYNSAFLVSAVFTAAGFIILMIYKSREKRRREVQTYVCGQNTY